MSKRNSILGILLLFVFISVCCLSIAQVQTDVKVGNKQNNIDTSTFDPPKISAYDVTEKWNYTSNYNVSVVAVSADGNYMAVGAGNISFFFNTSDHNGIPMWSYDAGYPIDSIAISADGSYIIAAGHPPGGVGKAFLFNSTVPNPGEEKEYIWFVYRGNAIISVDISADGKYIVLGDNEGALWLYNNSYASTGYDKTVEYLWVYGISHIRTVAISADGRYVAAGNDDTIFLFNTTDYTLKASQMPMWSFDAGFQMDSIAISADGSYIAAGTSEAVGVGFLLNNTIPELGLDKEEVWSFNIDDWAISSVDISADGKYVVVGWDCINEGDGGRVDLYDNSYPSIGLDKADEYLWWDWTHGRVRSVSISADGQYIAAGTYLDIDDLTNNTIYLFENRDYSLGNEHDPFWTFKTYDDINSVSMSAWGNYIAAGGIYG